MKDALQEFVKQLLDKEKADELLMPGEGNAAIDKAVRALRQILAEPQGQEELETLLTHKSVVVRSWTSTALLLLGTARAQAELESIAARKDIHGFGATVTLRLWRAGDLKPYW